MTIAEDLGAFASRASWDQLSATARLALKAHVLDGIGCALGALDAGPMPAIRQLECDFGGGSLCTLIGGGMTAPDRAAFMNGALVRYLDFNDVYFAPGETCHPSDSLAAVLAAAECANIPGQTFLAALAVAYQVQCRLSDEAPVRDKGFDHTTHLACAIAAGTSRALGLDAMRAANAIAIAATISPALRVTRTGALSHWKGLAAAHAAFAATHATFLASRGITGPPEAFEGNKGFMDTITGRFSIDWRSEDLERVASTSIKRFNAEAHAQSAIEGLLDLLASARVAAQTIRRIAVDTFGAAHRIIGGGEEGDKTLVRTKEEADHSLPYMLAVAAIDGRVMPEQYAPDRIARRDVQDLLRKIVVRPDPALTADFPRELPCRLRIELDDGRVLTTEKRDYLGFASRPMSWQDVRSKFDALATGASRHLRARIVDAVASLDTEDTRTLCELLSLVPARPSRARAPSQEVRP